MKLKDYYLSLIKEGKKYNIEEIDIRYLLSFFYKIKDNTSFFTSLDKEININNKFIKSFEELKKGKPLAYIINKVDFLGREYYVDERVLIPRVETEELVSLAVSSISNYFGEKKLNLLDIGTGSGVIAINMKKNFINSNASAIDISKEALSVARKNIKNNKLDISLYYGDTFPNNKDKYDVIISNPPYIKYKKDIDKSVIDYEPISSLLINKENNVYEKVMKSKRMKSPCLLIFEISPDLVNDLKKLMSKYLKEYVFKFSKDINGKIRFLTLFVK